jgi:Tol biopolymer transport system component
LNRILCAASIALLLGACAVEAPAPRGANPVPPQARAADSLIRDGETHFAHLWQLTFGGENAEAYWSGDGTKLIFQSTRDGYPCDQIYTMDLESGEVRRVSTGKGRTTCAYFYEGDQRILYASTHLGGDDCPVPPDYSQGYVWPISDTYDIFTSKPDGTDLVRLTDTPGYDAEGTVSRDGQWIVFTSVRDGDLDIYKMRTNGTEVTRLTDAPGYDGGAFFSPDGASICYRAYYPASDTELADYRRLLGQGLIRPGRLDLWVMNSDGSAKRRVTQLPGASFAPFYSPQGNELIFSSNWENPEGRNFDLFMVSAEGGPPSPVTRDASFDGFPMFSPDGRWLTFASNRGSTVRGETNVFLAEWKE